VVLTGTTGTLRPHPHLYGPAEVARADGLLDLVGCLALAKREIRTCSQGERQRVRVARALMPAPRLLLMDEPANGLDLPAREALLAALEALAVERSDLATVLVSHHLEELPRTTSRALLIRHGEVIAAGATGEVLNGEMVSTCFGIRVDVDRVNGRWTAHAVPGWRPSDES
jgi:iron complex transport system ATP-binding protein